MPLDPKQQPPYYTPGSSTGITQKFARLNAQYNAIQTSGTAETDLYLYQIPANTLINNGDAIHIQLSIIQSANGANNILRFYIESSNEYSNASDNKNHITLEIQLIKISSSQLAGTYKLRFDLGTGETIGGEQTFQTASTINFTQPIDIKFTGECDTPGQLQTYSMTIDKISI